MSITSIYITTRYMARSNTIRDNYLNIIDGERVSFSFSYEGKPTLPPNGDRTP